MTAQSTILFMPESAYGPTNQCIGLGDLLRRRGHRVVFAAESSWRGRLAPLGFDEDLVDLAPPGEDASQDAGQFWKNFIRDTAPEFRKPTIEQLAGFIRPTWQALIDGARYCEPQLKDIVARTRPDVIVEDNVVSFPALMTAPAPFVRIVSCNPLEIKGPDVPPTFSGYPVDDRSEWRAFRDEYQRVHRDLWDEFNAWVRECGAPQLPDLDFMHPSTQGNLYIYPEEADYIQARPLDATWRRMDSSVRRTDEPFEFPEALRDRPAGTALIYLSLGSLGSADVDLMRRLVDCLSRTPHRYIVSTGPRHAEYTLADNMVGAEFLPQVSIIPWVDAVITHGGNNTTTEAVHFGKPMISLPLFWDQHDNAQRMHEVGFGVRLDTYGFSDEEMDKALDFVLDPDVRRRVASVGAAIRTRDGLARGADLIESIARAGHRER